MTYQHDNSDKNLMGIQNALKYDGDGEPTLRVSIEEISEGANMTINGDVIVTDITGVVEINNDEGNPIPVSGTVAVSGITGTVNVSTNPTSTDAFGRQRVSNPLTLFDSSHRFKDNGLWATSTVTGGSVAFSPNEGLVNLTVDTTTNAEVIRETLKVFSYQPGKSLLNLNTFVFSPAKPNLRQRVGYFGVQNGMYLELDGSTVSFVERSYVTGAVTETRVNQADWNIDPMDGTGPSGFILDISKAQILWMDVEWLGLGTVRLGFVIDGRFVHCHSFHHANRISSTYITTASLPLRYEIKNTGVTSSSSTLKQICSSVMSEGGYELRGQQNGIGTPITSPKVLTTKGVYYPVVAIRLKANFLDAIVIPTAISFLGTGNGMNFNWKLIGIADVTSASWTSAGNDSAVEYTISGTAVANGRVIASGFINSSNQGSPALQTLKEALFQFQLERNSFTSTPHTFALAVSCDTDNQVVFGAIDWEEITR